MKDRPYLYKLRQFDLPGVSTFLNNFVRTSYLVIKLFARALSLLILS